MNNNDAGKMLALAHKTAGYISEMKGVQGNSEKALITEMIIQNLHEALLAFDKGVDMKGNPVSQEEIGEGLMKMLDHLRDTLQWAKLQEGLLAVDVNRTVILTGQIRAASDALMNMPEQPDAAEQISTSVESGELKDFQRQETVYEEIQNKGALESGNKTIKIIAVILAALIWLLLLLVYNPSNPGPGFILGHLLQAGFIFSITTLIIRKILRKQG